MYSRKSDAKLLDLPASALQEGKILRQNIKTHLIKSKFVNGKRGLSEADLTAASTDFSN